MPDSLKHNKKEIFKQKQSGKSTFKPLYQPKKESPQAPPRKLFSTLPFETISLFSVDQIRERESPWKALTETTFRSSGQQRIDRSAKRSSPFKQRLQERKKICMLYGNLPKRLLDRYLKEISRPEDLMLKLESRLDIVLKRSSLFPCIPSARRAILQGNISVNHQIVCSPKYHCTPGSLIKVLEKRNNAQRGVAEALLQHDFYKKEHTQSSSCSPSAALKRCQALHLNEWNNIFAFSERLRAWYRKAGRLHTSVFENKTEWGNLRVKGPSLMPLHKPIVNVENKLKEYKNHYYFTDTDSFKPTASIANSLGKGYDNSLLLGKKNTSLIKRRISNTNQLFAGERAEWDTPPFGQVGSRPIHLEVSYRNLCVIFLYPPQRVCVDISIDLFRLF